MKDIIDHAIKEDLGSGDMTTRLTVPKKAKASALIIAKEPGIISGTAAAKEVFRRIDRRIKFVQVAGDGRRVKKGSVIARLSGPAGPILTGERTALNFLQRLSGIATLTDRFVSKIIGTKAVILDTRKTVPGMRALEKAAVKDGGGKNHRMGLYDAILIKDNHIAVAGGITEAIDIVKARLIAPLLVEVEAESLGQVREALEAGADRVLLDNMNIKMLKQSVKMIRAWNLFKNKKVKCEASGGVGLDNVGAVAGTGVDYISIGELTHSPKALDISLEIRKCR